MNKHSATRTAVESGEASGDEPAPETPIPQRLPEADQLFALLHEALSGYTAPPDLDLIARAYHLAELRHRNQKRASGEPYILHPIEVARILAGYRLDAPTIAAALLHDTVEDTGTELGELSEKFGDEVMMLV
ncbi:MAG: HD domain-containing protein, partial [Candidatus Eremiobacterota bacterium]